MKRRGEKEPRGGGMYTGEVIKGLSPTIEKEGIEPPRARVPSTFHYPLQVP